MNNNFNKPTRAEMVRQRQNSRSIGSNTKPKKATGTGAGRRTSTPVYTRGVVNGFNYTPPVQQRVRKQYYYTVGTSGTEIRMPAIPTIKVGWRLLSFVLLVGVIFVAYNLFTAPFLIINTFQLDGINRVTLEDINHELDLVGKSIVYANPNKAADTLTTAFPELYNLKFSITLPNQIHISAIERQPVLAWQANENLYWVDQEGVLIPPRGESPELLTIHANHPPTIIQPLNPVSEVEEQETNNFANSEKEEEKTSKIIESSEPVWGDRIDSATINAAYQLQTIIPSGTTIIFDEKQGMGWRAQQGWDVFIGLTLNDIEYKLKAYDQLINKLSMEGITPSMVSVEYVHAPFYRE